MSDYEVGGINHPAGSSRPGFWKRPLDLVLGGVLTAISLPVIGALALVIRLDSPGPAFYRQERIGKDGGHFFIWKFRSMSVDADHEYHRQAAAVWFDGKPSSAGYKTVDDARITRAGRWLRRTSLDELPQLFNVLRGEMSLVGPRPAIPYELAHYRPWYFSRLAVKPGMTGLWQILGRDRLQASEMMVLDRRYVQECSFGLDLKILALTLPALLGARVQRV